MGLVLRHSLTLRKLTGSWGDNTQPQGCDRRRTRSYGNIRVKACGPVWEESEKASWGIAQG